MGMFSPSVNNCKPTESTLKFAVTAGMVKVNPVKAEVSLNVEKLVQQLRKHIEENDKLIDGQEASLMEKRTVLEQLKQELMVAGGDFDNVHAADQQDMKEQGFQGAEYVASKNKMKGKDVSHLEKSVLDKLAYLDEESDDGFGDMELDEMFSPEAADDLEDELQRQLDSAFKQASKGGNQGAAKLLKEAAGGEYNEEKEKDMELLEEQMEETLHVANMDLDDMRAQNEAMDEMLSDQVVMDFQQTPVEEVVVHVKETWAAVEQNKEAQKELKKAQENVVGHLVETNEWLFAALQEQLQTK